MPARSNENTWIAARLREAGDLLQAQGANPFRAGAYHHAADTVEQFEGSVREEFDRQGPAALQRLPGVGVGIASAIAEMLVTGHWSQLARLRGESDESASHAPETAPREAPAVALLLDSIANTARKRRPGGSR